jgi:hypothetical protein
LYGVLVTGTTVATGTKIPFDTIVTSRGPNLSMGTGGTGAGVITLTGNHIYFVMYSVSMSALNGQARLMLNGSSYPGMYTQSSNSSNVNHTASGLINLLGQGNATITVRYVNGSEAVTDLRPQACEITVAMLL